VGYTNSPRGKDTHLPSPPPRYGTSQRGYDIVKSRGPSSPFFNFTIRCNLKALTK